MMAIKEIDAEAAQYGLARTREYWLQTFLSPAGTVVRRGFCFRPGPSGIGGRLAAARQHDLVGVSSSDIVREMRDTE